VQTRRFQDPPGRYCDACVDVTKRLKAFSAWTSNTIPIEAVKILPKDEDVVCSKAADDGVNQGRFADSGMPPQGPDIILPDQIVLPDQCATEVDPSSEEHVLRAALQNGESPPSDPVFKVLSMKPAVATISDSDRELGKTEAADKCDEGDDVEPPFDLDSIGWMGFAVILRIQRVWRQKHLRKSGVKAILNRSATAPPSLLKMMQKPAMVTGAPSNSPRRASEPFEDASLQSTGADVLRQVSFGFSDDARHDAAVDDETPLSVAPVHVSYVEHNAEKASAAGTQDQPGQPQDVPQGQPQGEPKSQSPSLPSFELYEQRQEQPSAVVSEMTYLCDDLAEPSYQLDEFEQGTDDSDPQSPAASPLHVTPDPVQPTYSTGGFDDDSLSESRHEDEDCLDVTGQYSVDGSEVISDESL